MQQMPGGLSDEVWEEKGSGISPEYLGDTPEYSEDIPEHLGNTPKYPKDTP